MDTMDPNDSPRFRPFGCHVQVPVKVKKAKYSTSLDPRGYIPVYEYMINGQPIMWDRETGYVFFTGIWKSLNNSKADIVKMVDSNPDLRVKKIRGGFLKIQGTWIPYEFALILCKRTAFHVRKELVPVFGARFVDQCLEPDHPQYGCLLLDPNSTFNRPTSSSRVTTMRQSSHPYKRDYMRRASRDKPVLLAPRKSSNPAISNSIHSNTQPGSPKHSKDQTILLAYQPSSQDNTRVASSMSLSRLLNQPSPTLSHQSPLSLSSFLDDPDDLFDRDSQSPNTTPSPTFPRHYQPQSFDWPYPDILKHSGPVLAPIYSSSTSTSSTSSISTNNTNHIHHNSNNTLRCSSTPRILPIVDIDWSHLGDLPNEPLASGDPETLERINASIILYCMSQNAARNTLYSVPDSVPHQVVVDTQDFRIIWQPIQEENVVN